MMSRVLPHFDGHLVTLLDLVMDQEERHDTEGRMFRLTLNPTRRVAPSIGSSIAGDDLAPAQNFTCDAVPWSPWTV